MKGEKGITLIALSVILVLMLILAGVIILVNPDETTMELAKEKKQETEILLIKEQIKTVLSDNKPNNFEELKKILKYFGTIQNEENIDNAILVTDKGEYSINIKDIWNLNPVNAGIKIGDYIQYNILSKSYNVSGIYSGTQVTTSINLEQNNNQLWRVLDINKETGNIYLIPEDFNNILVELSGANGYNNISKLLNDICDGLLSDKENGIIARSINLEDIEKIANNINILKGDEFGLEQNYISSYYPISLKLNNEKEYIDGNEIGDIIIKNNYYEGQLKLSNDIFKDFFKTGKYWLATNANKNLATSSEFYGRSIVVENQIITLSGEKLYDTTNNSLNKTANILPILEINKDLTISQGQGTKEVPYKISNN